MIKRKKNYFIIILFLVFFIVYEISVVIVRTTYMNYKKVVLEIKII